MCEPPLRLANLADTLCSSFKRLQRGGAARVAWGRLRDRASRLCLLLEAPQLAARPSIRTHTPSNTTFNITKLTTPSLHPPLPPTASARLPPADPTAMTTLRALVLLVMLALSSSTASSRLLHSLGEDGGLQARRTGAADSQEAPQGPIGGDADPQLDPTADGDGNPANNLPLPDQPAAPEEQPAGTDSTTGGDDTTVLPEQQQEAQPEEQAAAADVAEAEQAHVDVSDLGIPSADLSTASAFPDTPTDGEVAATFDLSDAEDDAEFAEAAAASGDTAMVGAAPSETGSVGCHPHPHNVHAYW